MKIQELFQGAFKLISIMAQFLYLRRQAVEHRNLNVIGLWYLSRRAQSMHEMLWSNISYFCLRWVE